MCLLIARFQLSPERPLVIAANRDEQLARPAIPMTVLRESNPRIVGGRDLIAGGTWMAISERGVVAALTNVPSLSGRDPSKRSRGELPIFLARHASAAEAAAAFAAQIDPTDYNPCWVLVGDRDGLFYFDLSAGDPLVARALPPGMHVLENRPLEPVSLKAAFIRSAVHSALASTDDEVAALHSVLRSHELPPGLEPGDLRPAVTYAACVHGGELYGTRTGAIIRVNKDKERPEVYFTSGPPCRNELLREDWDQGGRSEGNGE